MKSVLRGRKLLENRIATNALKVFVLAAVFAFGLLIGNGRLDIERRGDGSVALGGGDQLDYRSVERVYDVLRREYDGELTAEQALNGLKEGLAEATGDDYTEYFDAKEAEEFNEQLDGSFEGIGAELGKDESNYVIIIAPLPNTPAERAGVKPRDLIVKVNDEDALGWSVEEAKNKIRGPKGTSVKLSLSRDGQRPFDVSITRDQITIESVEAQVEGQVGTIKINQFGSDTATKVRQAASEFDRRGVKGVIVDVRGNPGGYLDSAVDVSGVWLGRSQKVVDERRGNTVLRTRYPAGDPLLRSMPTVVLINEGSASASEILAGALRDHGIAVLVGTPSFGKGSVQQVTPLPDGGSLKVTIARWFTPAGKNIDKEGIQPDHKVELTPADEESRRDPQREKALELLRQRLQ